MPKTKLNTGWLARQFELANAQVALLERAQAMKKPPKFKPWKAWIVTTKGRSPSESCRMYWVKHKDARKVAQELSAVVVRVTITPEE